MRKGIKIGIVVVVAIVALFFIAAIASGPYVNHDVSAISGIDKFVVLEQGSQYIARFSLVDNDLAPAAADVNVTFSGGGWVQTLWVPSSEFKTYQLALTGAEFIAYAWPLDSDYDFDEYPDAAITVTLPDGRQFDAETRVF